MIATVTIGFIVTVAIVLLNLYVDISGLLMIRHLGNDILQVIPWVHIVRLAGGQQGTDYRHVNGSLVITTEEIVLAPLCWHYIYVGIIE